MIPRHARSRHLGAVHDGRPSRRGLRLSYRGHKGAGELRRPPSRPVGRPPEDLGLLQGVPRDRRRGRQEDGGCGKALPHGQDGHRTRPRRQGDDPLRRLLHPERGARARHRVPRGRHQGHQESSEVELPVHRLPQVVQGEIRGVPGVRVPHARLPQEAILMGRCACSG